MGSAHTTNADGRSGDRASDRDARTLPPLRFPDGRRLAFAPGEARVMGIVNVAPDSFWDGGRFGDARAAVAHGLAIAAEGAAILDVGGESSRPGAEAVSEADEIARVVPVIEGLRAASDVPISIDTQKPRVAAAAIDAGAVMINDIQGLRPAPGGGEGPGMIEVAARAGVPVCCMHMLGVPRTMQQAPRYENVVDEVLAFLGERLDAIAAGGVPREQVVVDPGFGFGKTLSHNLALLREIGRFVRLGVPVMVGLSRKSMFGKLTGAAVEHRLPETLAAHVLAAQAGVQLIRVHDVAAHVKALAVVGGVADPDAAGLPA